MGLCFICDTKLYGERTRVCSSITPHSNVPYPEKIVELMGEEFVVIVTPVDHMCKKCTSLLTHMDKLENDLRLVKNALLSYIQKKYGLLPADQPIKTLDVVNGHLKADEQVDAVVPKKAPIVPPVRESVPAPLKMLRPTQRPPSDNSGRLKIYKCGFCAFQSKELGHVRFHMRTHVNKKTDAEKANQPPTSATLAVPPPSQKKRLYRCQVCSASFDSRLGCLDHIQKDHSSPTYAANEEKEAEDTSSAVSSSTTFKQDASKSENGQQGDAPMDDDAVAAAADDDDDDQQVKSKGTVDTDMLLNNHVKEKETAVNGSEESKNAEEAPEKALKEAEPEESEAEQPAAAVAAEETPAKEKKTVVKQEEEEEMAVDGDEAKAGDLDIESMLAAIHNDDPTESGDTGNED